MEKPVFHYELFYFIYIYLDEMSKIQSLLPCSQQPGLDVTASLCITALLDCNYAFVHLSPSLKHECLLGRIYCLLFSIFPMDSANNI